MKLLMSGLLAGSALVLVGCSASDGNGFQRNEPITNPLNDTGITLCGDYAYPDFTDNNNVDCNVATQTVAGTEVGNGDDPVPAGQDGHYGRDVTDNSNSDGYKGFSFTKLGAAGVALAIQNATYTIPGLESNGTTWSCVRDEVTGLVWEIKSDDNGLHDKDWLYNWYNSDTLENGGNSGTADTVTGFGTNDNCKFQNECDTEKYVNRVNSNYFCGSNKWRLPSRAELKTLRHLGVAGLAIEQDYFPNTPAANFWTATPRAAASTFAWAVDFNNGRDNQLLKSQPYAVRLVRDAN